MNYFLIFSILIAMGFLFNACGSNNQKRKVGSYEDMKKELASTELEKTTPIANIDELEVEVNNGGLNQYFFNSSGQNAFATLAELKKKGKIHTAKILEQAIQLINPKNLPEKDFLEKLRKRQVAELSDSIISSKLESLDQEFYKYPDGSLE